MELLLLSGQPYNLLHRVLVPSLSGDISGRPQDKLPKMRVCRFVVDNRTVTINAPHPSGQPDTLLSNLWDRLEFTQPSRNNKFTPVRPQATQDLLSVDAPVIPGADSTSSAFGAPEVTGIPVTASFTGPLSTLDAVNASARARKSRFDVAPPGEVSQPAAEKQLGDLNFLKRGRKSRFDVAPTHDVSASNQENQAPAINLLGDSDPFSTSHIPSGNQANQRPAINLLDDDDPSNDPFATMGKHIVYEGPSGSEVGLSTEQDSFRPTEPDASCGEAEAWSASTATLPALTYGPNATDRWFVEDWVSKVRANDPESPTATRRQLRSNDSNSDTLSVSRFDDVESQLAMKLNADNFELRPSSSPSLASTMRSTVRRLPGGRLTDVPERTVPSVYQETDFSQRHEWERTIVGPAVAVSDMIDTSEPLVFGPGDANPFPPLGYAGPTLTRVQPTGHKNGPINNLVEPNKGDKEQLSGIDLLEFEDEINIKKKELTPEIRKFEELMLPVPPIDDVFFRPGPRKALRIAPNLSNSSVSTMMLDTQEHMPSQNTMSTTPSMLRTLGQHTQDQFVKFDEDAPRSPPTDPMTRSLMDLALDDEEGEEMDDDSDEERVQKVPEADTRRIYKTMGQRRPRGKGNAKGTSHISTAGLELPEPLPIPRARPDTSGPATAPKVEQLFMPVESGNKRMREILEYARSFKGTLESRVQLGQIFLYDFKNETKAEGLTYKCMKKRDLEDGLERMLKAGDLKIYFSDRMTTSLSDACQLVSPSVFNQSPCRSGIIYEFTLLNHDDGEIHVMITDNPDDAKIFSDEKSIGEQYLHFPKRIWDARFSVFGQSSCKVQDAEAVQKLVDSILVNISEETYEDNLSQILRIDFRIETTELRIKKVQCKRYFCHESLKQPLITLVVTEVRDLVVQNNREDSAAWRARSGFPVVMAEEHALWYETKLVIPSPPAELNQSLELGDEADWVPEDVLGNELIEDLKTVVEQVVTRSDSIGLGNKGLRGSVMDRADLISREQARRDGGDRVKGPFW